MRLPSGEKTQSRKLGALPAGKSFGPAISRSEPSARLWHPDLRRAAAVGDVGELHAVGRPRRRHFVAGRSDDIARPGSVQRHFDDVITRFPAGECKRASIRSKRRAHIARRAGREGPGHSGGQVDEDEMILGVLKGILLYDLSTPR